MRLPRSEKYDQEAIQSLIKRSAYLLDHLNDRVSKQLRTRFAELQQGSEARIRVAQDTMAVSAPQSHSPISATPNEERLHSYPGTTWPLFRVFQRNSLMWSCVSLSPSSLRMLSCQRSTSWFAKLQVSQFE